ncbi:unnamed protein product [Xylocopa violacea]|uniref:Apple domain-containing protein n=1 Tax=Xylocopa violacea TaxID=135666 RepID=A0ABP1PE18_XYLVO
MFSWFRNFIFLLFFLHSTHTSTISERNNNDDFALVICHRKLQPGKKMMELLIERVVNCENLQDCCRACDYEKSFACKGFNHRTDNSKCTCELTSTPYLHMDADEDFLVDSHCDYYEKVENCPSTIHSNRVPYWKDFTKNYRQNDQDPWLDRGSVNKDFHRESSISEDHLNYRNNYASNHESNHDFVNGLTRSNEQYHYEEPHDFMPRYNDFNWNRNWKNSHHPDVANDNTLPSSRTNNYDREYLSVKSSIFPKPLSRSEDRPLVRGISTPIENEHFHGKLNNYGNAFNYNDNYAPFPKDSHYERHESLPPVSRCLVRLASGSKLNRRVIRKTCLAHDLKQCKDLCINEANFSCESFAYRYNVLTTNPADNCLLSDYSYQDLNFYTDLDPNRDYDTYVLMSDSKICHLKKPANRYPQEECFSRIKSGFTIPIDITKKSILVHDLGECQFACTASQEFICRSFVYKYTIESHGDRDHEPPSVNCFLTDWSSGEINPTNMLDMDGAELYERTTFSNGCDTYPSSSIPNAITPNNHGFSPVQMDELCYSEYHRPCKLMPHAVISSVRAIEKSDCRRKCSTMRHIGTIPCMSFNYVINIGDTQNNCFLSDISIRDLRPNLDYIHDNDHTLYMWKDFDPNCKLIANSLGTINVPPLLKKDGQLFPPTLSYPNTQRTLDNRTHIPESVFDFSTRWKSKFKSDGSEPDYKYDTANGDSKFVLDSDGFQYGSNFFDSNQLSPSRQYTVNGYPCKNGTVCQQNEITGFWSCEIDNNYDNWDYCCKPTHQCGFSQGYHYPWCYVGTNEDQWRPCSETYHPYYFNKDQRSTLYSARHWPVIYLHETSPTHCSRL